MSDKDYSGCGFSETYFEDEEIRCNCPIEEDGICENNPNCYYKQLQAKTDECAIRQQDYNLLERQFAQTGLTIENLKQTVIQENTALKQQLDISVEALGEMAEHKPLTEVIYMGWEYYNKLKKLAKTAQDRIKGEG